MCQLVPGPPSYVQLLPGSLARTCPSGLHTDSGWELPGEACAESPRTEGLFGSFSGLPAHPAVGTSGSWKFLGDSSLNTGPNTHVLGGRQWIGPRDAPSCLRFPDLSCRHSPAHMTSGCPLPEDVCPWSPHRAGGCQAGPDLWGSSLGSTRGSCCPALPSC